MKRTRIIAIAALIAIATISLRRRRARGRIESIDE